MLVSWLFCFKLVYYLQHISRHISCSILISVTEVLVWQMLDSISKITSWWFDMNILHNVRSTAHSAVIQQVGFKDNTWTPNKATCAIIIILVKIERCFKQTMSYDFIKKNKINKNINTNARSYFSVAQSQIVFYKGFNNICSASSLCYTRSSKHTQWIGNNLGFCLNR